jgi:hypothetical protein
LLGPVLYSTLSDAKGSHHWRLAPAEINNINTFFLSFRTAKKKVKKL